MFALALTLTLGSDPTATEMAKPPARVIDPTKLVQPGMRPKEVIRLLGCGPRIRRMNGVPAAGGGGVFAEYRAAIFRRPCIATEHNRIAIEFDDYERVKNISKSSSLP
jgi:hypothetical protein